MIKTFLAAMLALGIPCTVQRSYAQTNFAVLATDGAWTWYNDPRALFHEGLLYFGYVRASDGRSALSTFNLQTGGKTDLWTSTRTEVDDHDVPGLLVKQDGTMPGSRTSTTARCVSTALSVPER